jgi:N-acetylmuramic acid 6-phosphate etherase
MFEHLVTEKRNHRTMRLDQMSIREVLTVMNEEDQYVVAAVQQQIPLIEQAVEHVVQAFQQGGRLIYLGAGTSGRMGLLDAVECTPTFGTPPEQVVGLMAGGTKAFVQAVEGAEDQEEQAVDDLKRVQLTPQDVLVGITASGRTPYVLAGLAYACQIGTATVSLSCNPDSISSRLAQVAIEVVCGAEVVTGSTRLKAGSAQKMVCNMLSTAAMIHMGKVYENLMVDLQPTNDKLIARAKRIVREATGCDEQTAVSYLQKTNNQTKVAIVMILTQCSYEEALQRLKEGQQSIRKAVNRDCM